MIATDDAQLEEKFELELVSSRDEFHLKWKMKENSPPERTRKKKKNSVSLSTSVSKAEALLSGSQKLKLKLKLYSLGLICLCLKSWNSLGLNSLTLSVSTLSVPLSLHRNFLSLAPVTTGNQVKNFSLISPF